jgi:16S rRNA (adenine1518-N6/adenine1519-N6)-dimethyltransferase
MAADGHVYIRYSNGTVSLVKADPAEYREVSSFAVPGSGAYGRLSVLSQWRTTAKIAFTVPPRAFIPAPKVESAVIHIVPMEPLAPARPAKLAALTAAAFGQRRKMLRASLKSLPGALEAMVAEGIDPEARAETVPVAAFARAAARL